MNQSHPFANNCGSAARRIQFRLRYPSGKRKPSAIILDDQLPVISGVKQLHQYSSCTAVFTHIDQCFLHDLSQFAAHWRRQQQFLLVHKKAGRNSGLALKSLHGVAQEQGKFTRINIHRLHLLHELAQFQDFLAQQFLNSVQFAAHGFLARVISAQAHPLAFLRR